MCAERHTSVSDSPFVLPALLLCGFFCFSHECLCLGPHFFLFFCFHCFPFLLFALTDTCGTISPLKPSRSLPGKQSTTTILLRASFAQSAHASHLLGSFFLLLARSRSNFRCTSFRSTRSSSNSLKLIKCNYGFLSRSFRIPGSMRFPSVGLSGLPSLVSSAQFRLLLVCFPVQGSGAGAGSCASSPVAI